jgi:signal recognition particle receptor subunit beta
MLPLGFRAPSGLLIKFKLFTVPGQVAHDGTRKAVLSRADGVVFVADSQTNQGVNNAESFQNLADNVKRVGLNFETLPLVVQFNKRDLDKIVTEQEVRERWGATQWPLYFASALSGDGVMETFMALLQQVYLDMEQRFELKSRHEVSEDSFIQAVTQQQPRGL